MLLYTVRFELKDLLLVLFVPPDDTVKSQPDSETCDSGKVCVIYAIDIMDEILRAFSYPSRTSDRASRSALYVSSNDRIGDTVFTFTGV